MYVNQWGINEWRKTINNYNNKKKTINFLNGNVGHICIQSHSHSIHKCPVDGVSVWTHTKAVHGYGYTWNSMSTNVLKTLCSLHAEFDAQEMKCALPRKALLVDNVRFPHEWKEHQCKNMTWAKRITNFCSNFHGKISICISSIIIHFSLNMF